MKYRSWAWVRIGQFRPPSTMEGWTSVRYLDFLERSTPCQAFNSHRRIGAMAYAMRDGINLEVHPENQPRMTTVTFD